MPTRSRANIPHLNAEDVEFHALVREWFVSEGLALGADALLKARVHPEAVVSITESRVSPLWSTADHEVGSLPATQTEKTRLAKHHIVVHAAIRKCLESNPLRCARPTAGRGIDRRGRRRRQRATASRSKI